LAPVNKQVSFVNRTKETILATKVSVADSFLSRLVGLLGKASLEKGNGLYLTDCKCVHMFGMKFAIDVVFVSEDNLVIGVENTLLPGKISGYYAKAVACLELPAGTIIETNTQIGDVIEKLLAVS
jgi:uncharacterized membrane protein (UPF0127 family)